MSGKAPPRGPRALLSSLPTTTPASQSSPSAPSTSTSPGCSSKIGVHPPTAPRSLVNGTPTPSRTKPLVNGYPPTSPSALQAPRSSQKGKQPESGWSTSDPHESSVPSTTKKLAPATVEDGMRPHEPVKIAFALNVRTSLSDSRPLPPQPTSEPPPPPPPPGPPPSDEPPPPPPPQSPPPPPPPPSPPPQQSPPTPPPLNTDVAPPPPSRPTPSSHDHARSPSPPPPHTSPPHVQSPPVSRPASPPPAPSEPHPPPEPVASSSTPPRPRPRSPSPSPRTYSLPPLPPWPPSPSEYPPGCNFKIIYDPITDKDRDGRMRALLEKIHLVDKDRPASSEARINGKGKGKETITRYDGGVIDGELAPVLKDPRKGSGLKRRPGRDAFHEVKYEYDQHSTGPPPSTAVLITNISPLTPTQHIRRAFSVHGKIASFEPQIDMETGMALGVVFIRYHTHDEAKQCVERAHGNKLGVVIGAGEGDELKVVFDGEGLKLKAVLRELDERKKRDREERRRKERDAKAAHIPLPQPPPSTATPNSKHTPNASSANWRPSHQLPPRPAHIPHTSSGRTSPAQARPMKKQPPAPGFTKVRTNNSMSNRYTSLHDPAPPSHSSSSTPIYSRSRPLHFSHAPGDRTPRSRSPSPIARKPGQPSARHALSRSSASSAILSALSKNGYDHVRLELSGGAMHSVLESDVLAFFADFKVDSVLRDHGAWYVTFKTPDSARRAGMVLNSGGRTIAHHSVTITACPPPSKGAVAMAEHGEPTAGTKKTWTPEEMVQSAQQAILRELKVLLEKDITERVVAAGLRKLVAEEKAKAAAESKDKPEVDGEVKLAGKRGWKGLSFRKPGKRVREDEVKSVVVSVVEEEEVQVDEVEREPPPEPEPVVSPPKKKRKKEVVEKERSAEVESEVEDDVVLDVRKRILSEDVEAEEPIKKKAKKDLAEDEVPVLVPTKKAPAKKKALKKKPVREVVEEVILSETLDFVPPATTTIDVSKLESISRSPSPVPQEPPPPIGPLDPFQQGVCEDDEDLYFARLVLSGETHLRRPPSPPPDAVPPFRKHLTGSARTEGYYKISHAEKSAYVAQYTLRSTNIEDAAPKEKPPAQHVTSSRSNRANARRRAQGLEEINQVQRAVALSKGETGAAELSIKFNQLQTRKKHLRFARSPIHDWGLYAMERITRGEMVIEYVGEIIRAQVADKREKVYERQGIGSSYLFRIDEDLVVDATKKGNLGRLINHSCDPNCTAKIITISGEKKIVIYAKQDIELGDEITYDYHFPIEQDKIPCLCGSAKCRGYLN